MWIPVSWFRYNTFLSYPCGEQYGGPVCFYRRAVMTKGVTAPLFSLPGVILHTHYKMESQVWGYAAHSFQLFAVSTPVGCTVCMISVALPMVSASWGWEEGETEKEAAPFFPLVTKMVHDNQKPFLPNVPGWSFELFLWPVSKFRSASLKKALLCQKVWGKKSEFPKLRWLGSCKRNQLLL